MHSFQIGHFGMQLCKSNLVQGFEPWLSSPYSSVKLPLRYSYSQNQLVLGFRDSFPCESSLDLVSPRFSSAAGSQPPAGPQTTGLQDFLQSQYHHPFLHSVQKSGKKRQFVALTCPFVTGESQMPPTVTILWASLSDKQESSHTKTDTGLGKSQSPV